MTHSDLTALLRSYVIPFGTEADMQAHIYRILTEAGIEFAPEVRLTPSDRIDVLAGTVGIECKVDGSLGEVAQQLLRYASSDKVESLILVTRRRSHREITDTLGGKPVSLVWVAGHL